jgi:hypothetical protein
MALVGAVAGLRRVLGSRIREIHTAIEAMSATPAAPGDSVEMAHDGVTQAAVMGRAQIPSAASRTTHDNVRVSFAQGAFSTSRGSKLPHVSREKVLTRTIL